MKGSAMLPNEHKEMKMKSLECADMKYSHMSPPEELTKNADALARFVDKNKNKR
jgi:hypothetical protein